VFSTSGTYSWSFVTQITTGGKDKPNIVYMWGNRNGQSQHGTQNIKTYNRTTQKNQKLKSRP